MGTRAQCLIKDEGVYLYQHWDGYDLMNTVVSAVNSDVGKGRHSDPEYLTRIIFCEMVKDDINGETGFGIGKQEHGDIEYLVTVDCKKKTITERKVRNGEILRTVKFES
jgi:hypothetical protein